jgi:hypothetical protein
VSHFTKFSFLQKIFLSGNGPYVCIHLNSTIERVMISQPLIYIDCNCTALCQRRACGGGRGSTVWNFTETHAAVSSLYNWSNIFNDVYLQSQSFADPFHQLYKMKPRNWRALYEPYLAWLFLQEIEWRSYLSYIWNSLEMQPLKPIVNICQPLLHFLFG